MVWTKNNFPQLCRKNNKPTHFEKQTNKTQKTVETTKAQELRAVTEKKQRFTPGNYKANDPKTTQTFFMWSFFIWRIEEKNKRKKWGNVESFSYNPARPSLHRIYSVRQSIHVSFWLPDGKCPFSELGLFEWKVCCMVNCKDSLLNDFLPYFALSLVVPLWQELMKI